MSGGTIFNYQGKEIFLPESVGYVSDEQVLEFLTTFFPDVMTKLQEQIVAIRNNVDQITPDVDAINTTTANTFSFMREYFPSEFSAIKSSLSDIFNETSSIDGNVQSLNSTISNIIAPALSDIDGNISTMLDNQQSRFTPYLKAVDVSVNDMNVAAGAIAYHVIQPPEGELWRVKTLYIEYPNAANATSGNYALRIIQGGGDWWMASLFTESSFADPLGFRYGRFFDKATTSDPEDKRTQYEVSQNLVATKALPIQLRYNNYTNVTNNKKASIRLVVEVHPLV